MELGSGGADEGQMWRGITFLFYFHCFVHRSALPCPCLSSSLQKSQSITRLAFNPLSSLDFAVRRSKIEAEALEKELILLS